MKATWIRKSFKNKLLVTFILLVFIPIGFIYIIYNNVMKSIITTKYSESAKQSVYEAGNNIDFIIDSIADLSDMVVTNRDFIENLKDSSLESHEELNNILRNFSTTNEQVDSMSLIAKGKIYDVGTIKTYVEEGRDIRNINKTHGELVWIDTIPVKVKILSGEITKNYFSLGRKVIDLNSLMDMGTIFIDVDETILEDSYKNLITEESSELFICNSKGQIISHSNKEIIGKNIGDKNYALEVLSSNKDAGSIEFTDDDVEKVCIYSNITLPNWKIVKIVSKEYLYKEITNMQRYMFIGGTIYVIITILICLFFSSQISRPMVSMKNMMKKAEEGDLDVRINVDRIDELGELGNSFNNMIGKMNEVVDKLVEEERFKKELELETLHAQINPHFLYNTLNTIKWMAKIQGDKSVSNAVTSLIKLLRVSINLGKEMITLEDEIDYVRNYINIQNLRFNEKVNIIYNIDEECLKCTIPKLILQPIVENSLIYGIREDEEEEPLEISIKACIEEDNLIILVKDNGPGISDEDIEKIFSKEKDVNKFSKVGLNNVNQRIKLYCGEEYGINIGNRSKLGTYVKVEVPRIIMSKPADDFLIDKEGDESI
ncbi:sensor histidine kinase [Clostridium sp. UBA1056]|uniref:sensor histidine kinase n=1 Tax=unclassified Clostridium TaxID=2614128 RepID=UPI003217BBDE